MERVSDVKNHPLQVIAAAHSDVSGVVHGVLHPGENDALLQGDRGIDV